MTQNSDRFRAKSVSSVGEQLNHSMAAHQHSSPSGKIIRPKSVVLAPVADDGTVDEDEELVKGWRIPLPSWHFLGILLILFSGGVGFLAASVLLSFNGSNNCSALYMPLASATTRLYCAQIEAEEQKLENYLKAIRMVQGFPKNHPLRPDIDRNIEVWVADIIGLAEVKFQEGKLDEAIAMVDQIPEKAGFRDVIEGQVQAWQKIWREGEDILARLKRELRDGELGQAMRTAVQLSYLENKYWATVKYEEAMSQIQLARKESGELDGAYVAQRRGGIENWLRAIEQASKISKDSYAYADAQRLIDEAREKIIVYIQEMIEERQWSEVLEISDRLPSRLNLDNMLVDWRILAQAGITAKKGTVVHLETALVQVQSIQPSSSVYDQAQLLTQQWQKEITDASMLEQGQALAQGGTSAELQQAIAKLKLVPEGNPRYAEAQRQIREWSDRLESLEDAPILEYAKDLAATNRLARLKEAIAQAQSIQPGRALYPEAQRQIKTWQNAIERAEDQPIFDRAVALGQQNQLAEAIAVANQIGSNRALYGEMQNKVREWRQELNAINTLQNAYQTANRNSVSGWVEAIKLTQQIPRSVTQLRAEATQAANQWSFNILATAQNQANTSLPQAISTARQVPRYTAAYAAAQEQIDIWEDYLVPVIPNN